MNRSRFRRPLRAARYVVLPTCRGRGIPWGEFAREAPELCVCVACGLYADLCKCDGGPVYQTLQTARQETASDLPLPFAA